MGIIVQWSQIVMLILMIVGLIYAWIQIRLMQRNETSKKRLAVLSLIQELQYNKKLISEYIDHEVNGANVIPNKDGGISYELNKPSLIAYERNVILACGNDDELLKDIVSLYEKIDACKVLVDEVLLIVANNWIECKLSGKRGKFNSLVGKMNHRLSEEAKAVNKSINELIGRLEVLYRKIDTNDITRSSRNKGVRMSWLKKFGGLLGIEIEIGVVVSIITAGILVWQVIALNGQIGALKKQTEIQSKTMTVDNLIKLNQQIYPCERIKEIMEAVDNGNPILKENKGVFNKVELDNFLGYFEMLGIMEKRDYLDADLIYHMFGADIEAISNNKEIQKYLQDEKKKGCNWTYLKYVMQKVK